MADTATAKIIDHVALRVQDIAASRAFYEAALAPLGLTVVGEYGDDAVGIGRPGHDDFALFAAQPEACSRGAHVAFLAPDRAAVDAFHAAALAAGATDNGAPGVRPEWHAHYYGAFVHDPYGNNVEAVCHHES